MSASDATAQQAEFQGEIQPVPRSRARQLPPPPTRQIDGHLGDAVSGGQRLALRDVPAGSAGVVVADRQRWVADSIALWLQDEGFSVVAAVIDADGLNAAVADDHCKLALIDVDLPPDGGLAAGLHAASLNTGARVVLLSHGAAEAATRAARALGLSGCISKEAPPAQVARWLKAACSGSSPLPPDVMGEQSAPGVGILTGREQEILSLLGDGVSGRDIAAALRISHHTVRTHIQNILGKLNARSRIEAVAIASARGLLHIRREVLRPPLRHAN